MVESQTGQASNSDDLDLINLLYRLFSFFRKYFFILVFFTGAGMLTGYIFYKILPKVYQSTLLLHSSSLTNTEQINIIENWDDLLKNGEYNILGERLNCDTAMLRNLVSINASEIQKIFIPNSPNGFEVTVVVRNNGILDSLEKKIVYGLENSDFIKAKLASRRATIRELMDKIKIEISELDSTRKNIERSIGNNSQHGPSVIVDVSAISNQIISLNEKMLGFRDELKFSAAVLVYHKFEKFDKPASPKLFKLLILGFMGGFAIGYAVAMAKYLQQKFASRLHAVPAVKGQPVPGKKRLEQPVQ